MMDSRRLMDPDNPKNSQILRRQRDSLRKVLKMKRTIDDVKSFSSLLASQPFFTFKAETNDQFY
jgi:hypothetical protein